MSSSNHNHRRRLVPRRFVLLGFTLIALVGSDAWAQGVVGNPGSDGTIQGCYVTPGEHGLRLVVQASDCKLQTTGFEGGPAPVQRNTIRADRG